MYTLFTFVIALNLLQRFQTMSFPSNTAEWDYKKCCLCGNFKCTQSIDHIRIDINQLQTLIDQAKLNRRCIDSIKAKVKQSYSKLKEILIYKIEKDQKIFQQWINQFYYPQLTGKVNNNLLCKLAQKRYSILPNRSLPTILREINRSRNNVSLGNDISQATNNIQAFLEGLNIQAITDKPLRYLGVQYMANTANFNPTPSKTTISQISNPEYSQILPHSYQWRNIKINKSTRVAQFSNKNLKDDDLIKQVPKIGCFKSLKEFQARNNFITALSCRVIVNNLDFLQALDVRGNRIGDAGVQIIARGMPNLKNFLISQTGATDQSGKVISETMNLLQLFWGQNNQFSGEVIMSIASKPKLKVMSVSGNQINQKHKGMLHQIFVRKGYIVL